MSGTTPLFDVPLAEALKRDGINLALGSTRKADDLERAWDILVRLSEERCDEDGVITSDDVYQVADDEGDPLPDGLNMGGLFHKAHLAGLIEPVWCPSVPSKRPKSHRRALKVWRGVPR